MIEGVSHELFLQFVARVRGRLEAPEGATIEPQPDEDAIRIVPLVLKTVWSAIVRLFRRLLRRGPAERS
jgi:hypothetical protein